MSAQTDPPPERPALLDRGFLHEHLARLERRLDDLVDTGGAAARGVTLGPEVVAAARDALREERTGPDDGAVAGEHYSRNPIASIAQSAIDEATGGQAARRREPFAERVAARADQVLELVVENIWRYVHGKHAFCATPADEPLAPDARLVLVSDWGSGREPARRVSEAMRARIDEVEQGEVHVVHLGDTYYTGTRREAQENILDLWPVDERTRDPERVHSWVLMGNHDMYSGAHGFFETILEDPRFSRQRGGGEPTSWFRLGSGDWTVAGLDSAWHDPLVELLEDGQITGFGATGHLEPPQAETLGRWAAESTRLLVLSHHQLFSGYDRRDVGMRMKGALGDALRSGVDVWFWGHEHDCVAYDAHDGVGAARAIGHGAVPYPARPHDVPAMPGHPDVFVPERDVGSTSASRPPVAWDYRGSRPGDDGPVLKNGFAVVDLHGTALDVAYLDDDGEEYFRETL